MTQTELPGPDLTRAPAAGDDVVPAHHGAPVLRQWDGDVWLNQVSEAPAGTTLPAYHRNFLRFLATPNWILLLVLVAASVGGYFLKRIDPHLHRSEGVQWLLVPISAVGALCVLLLFLGYANRRLVFRQVVDDTKSLVTWGVISGVVALGVAVLFEYGIPHLFGSSMRKEDIWQWIPGPAEELGKVFVPIILWFTGRFRLPRQGILLVLISATVFGTAEGAVYGGQPDLWQWSRPLGELMHPMLAATAAAVAWRFAWGRSSWFTRQGILALLGVMFLHSANDGLIGLDHGHIKALGFITPLLFLTLYFTFKFASRQSVPPDNVASVSPQWRPVPARSLTKHLES